MNLANLGLQMLLGIIWGASFMFIKVGVPEIGWVVFPWLRVLIGALVLLAYIRLRGDRIPRDGHTWRLFLVQGLLGIALPFIAIAWGTQYIASGLSAILNGTMPMFTFVLAVLVDSEKLRLRSVVGLLVGLVGILVLMLPKLQPGMQTDLWGQLAVVGGALSYACSAVFARRYLVGQKPTIASFGQLATAALLLAPLALPQRPWAMRPSSGAIVSLLLLGVLGTGLAYLLYFKLIQDAGATGAALVTYISPVFSIFWGWGVLSERLTWHAFVAFALIFVGLLLVNGIVSQARALLVRRRGARSALAHAPTAEDR
jgi:drug/metabolite transporter (DMT)-like permease